MPEIRTRDEALAAVDAALAQWSSASAAALARAQAAAGAARSDAGDEVSRQERLVSELTDTLAALRDDDPLQAVVAAALARAKESLSTARRAAAAIADVAARVADLQRSAARNGQVFVEAARADLARRGGELGAYRKAGPAGLSGAPGGSGTARALGGLALGGAADMSPSGTGRASWLAQRGFADVDVALADFSDNPIRGEFGRGGLGRADYRWAVTAWDEVVRPGLDKGMTRDDFAARDAARGALPPRSYVEVYDIFLGSEPIQIDRRPDGTLHVNSGRHRLDIARELGIPRLPAKWGR